MSISNNRGRQDRQAGEVDNKTSLLTRRQNQKTQSEFGAEGRNWGQQ